MACDIQTLAFAGAHLGLRHVPPLILTAPLHVPSSSLASTVSTTERRFVAKSPRIESKEALSLSADVPHRPRASASRLTVSSHTPTAASPSPKGPTKSWQTSSRDAMPLSGMLVVGMHKEHVERRNGFTSGGLGGSGAVGLSTSTTLGLPTSTGHAPLVRSSKRRQLLPTNTKGRDGSDALFTDKHLPLEPSEAAQRHRKPSSDRAVTMSAQFVHRYAR